MKQIRKLGPMGEIMKMIPGMGGMVDAMQNFGDPDKDINHIDGIINSMTPWEREHPDKIDRSRRNRIARGSGSAPNEITNLLKQFEAMSSMMAKMSNMGFLERMRAVQEISKGGMAIPGLDTPMPKQRSSRGPADPKAAHEALKKKRKAEREAKKKNRRR
jgi:signal recognition particle subunit SRP54